MPVRGLDDSAVPSPSPPPVFASEPRGANGSTRIAAVLLVLMVAISALADTGEQTALFDAIRSTPHGDKVCHFLLFGALAFFAHRGLAFRTRRVFGLQVPLAPVVVLAFATLEELSQRYFPERSLDLVDWLADLCGIATFTWLSVALRSHAPPASVEPTSPSPASHGRTKL